MAEKQIVREDVISISFDVDNSGIAEIKAMADEIKASIASAVDSASGSLQEMAENASEVAESVEDIKTPLESVKETVEDLPAPVDEVNDSLKESSSRAKEFAERLKSAVSNVYAGDTENVYTGGNTTSETNNYNPTFNLTISGDTNEREMKRKVQQWIIEAMDKIDASEMRKSPQYQIL